MALKGRFEPDDHPSGNDRNRPRAVKTADRERQKSTLNRPGHRVPNVRSYLLGRAERLAANTDAAGILGPIKQRRLAARGTLAQRDRTGQHEPRYVAERCGGGALDGGGRGEQRGRCRLRNLYPSKRERSVEWPWRPDPWPATVDRCWSRGRGAAPSQPNEARSRRRREQCQARRFGYRRLLRRQHHVVYGLKKLRSRTSGTRVQRYIQLRDAFAGQYRSGFRSPIAVFRIEDLGVRKCILIDPNRQSAKKPFDFEGLRSGAKDIKGCKVKSVKIEIAQGGRNNFQRAASNGTYDRRLALNILPRVAEIVYEQRAIQLRVSKSGFGNRTAKTRSRRSCLERYRVRKNRRCQSARHHHRG
jgi:hypothetical protein